MTNSFNYRLLHTTTTSIIVKWSPMQMASGHIIGDHTDGQWPHNWWHSNNNKNQVSSHKVGLATWINRRNYVLSYIISLSNWLISWFFLIVSLIAFLGLTLSLENWLPPSDLLLILITTKSTCLLFTCPSHLSLHFHHVFYTSCYPNYLSNVFLIVSCPVLPQIQRNTIVSVTIILFSCWFFTAQHSIPYNITGL